MSIWSEVGSSDGPLPLFFPRRRLVLTNSICELAISTPCRPFNPKPECCTPTPKTTLSSSPPLGCLRSWVGPHWVGLEGSTLSIIRTPCPDYTRNLPVAHRPF